MSEPSPRRRRPARPRAAAPAERPPAATRRAPRRAPRPEPVAPVPVAPVPVAPPRPDVRPREAPPAGLYDVLWRTGIPSVLAIARRELGAFFVSPIGYVVAALLAPLVAFVAYLGPVRLGSPVAMDQTYSYVIFFSLLVAPLITMRLLAEERRQGTLEVTLTSPVRDWELVTGKWLGALAFYMAVTAFVAVIAGLLVYHQPTHQLLHPFGVALSVGNLDLGPVVTGYAGVLLAGGSFLAIGLLWSSVTSNQIIAAFAAFVSLIVLYVVFGFGALFDPPLSVVISYLSASNHYTSFNQGQLALKDAVYFLSLILGALFLTTRVLESRRWR